MERAPLQLQTAYAELIEQLTAIEAERTIGHTAGTFVVKTVKGQDYYYYYYQYPEPGGIVQRYVGRRTPVLERVIARFEQRRALVAVERVRIERLCAQLRAGGALTTDNPSTRVLAALADAAVFRLGGVLVGTHAFVVLGNLLGVRWESAGLRTEDVDIASARVLAIAVPTIRADVPKILESLEMGFLPVPGLAVVGGAGVLVNVPSAARFALHKLLVARARPATMQTKAGKDLHQAAQVIAALGEDRPGDLRRAWRALVKRGWSKAIRPGLAALGKRHPDAHHVLEREMR